MSHVTAFPGSTNKWSPHEYDQLVKLLLIGDSGVGKSCLLLRFCNDQFTPSFITTIGIDFKARTVDVDGTRMKLQVWDTAGQERFRTITTSTFLQSSALGVMIVYDYQQSDGADVEGWLKNVEEYANDQISIMLIGNKTDVDGSARVVTREEGEKLAKKYNIPFAETSAKSKQGVDDAFLKLTRQIKYRIEKNMEAASRPRTDSIRINRSAYEMHQLKLKKGSCC